MRFSHAPPFRIHMYIIKASNNTIKQTMTGEIPRANKKTRTPLAYYNISHTLDHKREGCVCLFYLFIFPSTTFNPTCPSNDSASLVITKLTNHQNSLSSLCVSPQHGKPGVGLTVRVAGLRSQGLEFKPLSTSWINNRWIDSACHPSEDGKMSASVLITGHFISCTPRKWCAQAAPLCLRISKNQNMISGNCF